MIRPPCGAPAKWVGLVALVIGLSITSAIAATHGWQQFIEHDARAFHAVAKDLDATDAVAGDSAYRYGRIGLPLLARTLALGDTGDLLMVTQALVTPLAFGVLFAAAVAIAVRVTTRWTDGLLIALVPGVWVGFNYAWADVLLAAVVMVSVWATLDRRDGLCVAAVALAALTKEVGALAVIPAVLAAWTHRDVRSAVVRFSGLAPALIWWLWVRLRSGEWPFLADDPARARAIAPPFVDLMAAVTGGVGDPAVAILALIVGLVGLTVLVQHPRHPLGWSAGIWAGLTLCLGDNVLRYPGDALRVMTPSMCVIVLAFWTLNRREVHG